MTDFKDNPREVLALLNSLGFVGITAPQLKAFMKDLKMYRKVKERERQQWKDETKKKILSKQESMLKKLLYETLAIQKAENVASHDSSEREDPLLRIKVRCVSEDEEHQDAENTNDENNECPISKLENLKINHSQTVASVKNCKISSSERGGGRSKSSERRTLKEIPIDNSQRVSVQRRTVLQKKINHDQNPRNYDDSIPARPSSAPNFVNERTVVSKERSKSVASERTVLTNTRSNPSRCSTRSQTKSFIRPWRLQPEAQRAKSAKKSDPVALYQKYQQEWKQISFPGEEQHARVRWAIREKMLGSDPNPRPILKNSESLMSIKKR